MSKQPNSRMIFVSHAHSDAAYGVMYKALWNRFVLESVNRQSLEQRVEVSTIYYPEQHVDAKSPWHRRIRDLRNKMKHGLLRLFGYGRPRYNESTDKLAESFCLESLSWLQPRLAHQQEALNRAKSLCNDFLEFGRIDNHDCSQRISMTYHLRSWFSESNNEVDDNYEFAGLVLYLAATFRGSREWLGQERSISSAFLISNIYKALGSTVALFNRDERCVSRFESSIQMREHIVAELLKSYGLTFKSAALGDLKGCLIRTRFGSSVYVNDALAFEQKEWVTFHELGHFLLHSQFNSGFGRHSETRSEWSNLFIKRELQANGFADLWQHVIEGLVDHLRMESPQFDKHTPELKETTPEYACSVPDHSQPVPAI